MDDELKPCPFCGAMARLEYIDLMYRIRCCDVFGCGANQGFFDTVEKAIAKWNRRADDE